MTLQSQTINEMISYYRGDPKRIHHFLKVYEFAKTIAETENIDKDTLLILELAAIVHDIGIKPSEQKYNSSAGKYQEIEGPEPAAKLLKKLNVSNAIIERVKYLVGHHHTYENVDGMDYQILIEADFIVNAYEDNLSVEAIRTVREKIFRTQSGINMLNSVFNIP